LIVAGVSGVALHATQGRAATANVATSDAPIVAGLSTDELAKAGFAVTAAHDQTPAVSEAAAVKAALKARPGNAVKDVALGYCDRSAAGFASRDCYVVSFDVTGQTVVLLGPISYTGPKQVTMVASGVLVDAETGEVLDIWDEGAPIK
jgi:hypothetical protein